MTAAPAIVHDLIQPFDRNCDAYKSPAYNETQARREFIDPLFKALAWDVENEQGLAEAYKDVIHEDAIKVGGITKAPDYCFRIGGTRPQKRAGTLVSQAPGAGLARWRGQTAPNRSEIGGLSVESSSSSR